MRKKEAKTKVNAIWRRVVAIQQDAEELRESLVVAGMWDECRHIQEFVESLYQAEGNLSNTVLTLEDNDKIQDGR